MANPHALIIDDNHMNIDVLVMLLESESVDCTATDSIRKVSDTLDAVKEVDIIFLDLEFPNGDGFDIIDDLKMHPRLQNVPIVAYSVHTSEIDRARRAGFDSFLGKPLSSQQFPEQLRRILGGESVWEVN